MQKTAQHIERMLRSGSYWGEIWAQLRFWGRGHIRGDDDAIAHLPAGSRRMRISTSSTSKVMILGVASLRVKSKVLCMVPFKMVGIILRK